MTADPDGIAWSVRRIGWWPKRWRFEITVTSEAGTYSTRAVSKQAARTMLPYVLVEHARMARAASGGGD